MVHLEERREMLAAMHLSPYYVYPDTQIRPPQQRQLGPGG
jgi:hypothetical protein